MCGRPGLQCAGAAIHAGSAAGGVSDAQQPADPVRSGAAGHCRRHRTAAAGHVAQQVTTADSLPSERHARRTVLVIAMGSFDH